MNSKGIRSEYDLDLIFSLPTRREIMNCVDSFIFIGRELGGSRDLYFLSIDRNYCIGRLIFDVIKQLFVAINLQFNFPKSIVITLETALYWVRLLRSETIHDRTL